MDFLFIVVLGRIAQAVTKTQGGVDLFVSCIAMAIVYAFTKLALVLIFFGFHAPWHLSDGQYFFVSFTSFALWVLIFVIHFLQLRQERKGNE